MATSLLDALERLQPGDHLCSIYENETEQLASVVPYLRSGLERGEKCMCFGDERLLGGVRSALRAAGVDVSLAVRSGDLMLTAKREEFFDDGRFVPERWNQLWRGGAEKAAQEGYTAFRATGV